MEGVHFRGGAEIGRRSTLELFVERFNFGQSSRYQFPKLKFAASNSAHRNYILVVFFEVCKRHLPLLHYSGTDYSESAIKLAQETWNGGNFFVKDVKELTKEDVENYDLIYTSALFDVMPDGDEALEHLLQLSAKNIILSRMKTTDDESYYEEYEAYGITTCAFHHNKSNFLEMCGRYNYEVRQFADDHFLLIGDNNGR